MRNKFLLFLSYLACGILLQQLEWTETKVLATSTFLSSGTVVLYSKLHIRLSWENSINLPPRALPKTNSNKSEVRMGPKHPYSKKIFIPQGILILQQVENHFFVETDLQTFMHSYSYSVDI